MDVRVRPRVVMRMRMRVWVNTRIIGILTVGMKVRVNMKVRLRDRVMMRMKVRTQAREIMTVRIRV